MQDKIINEIQESLDVKEKTKVLAPKIQELVEAILSCYEKKGKVIFMGNGGSAADSQHLAAELVNRMYMDRAPLAGLALTTDTSVLTCIPNDYGYDQVFSKQMEVLCGQHDVVIGISTSGNSANVMEALKVAKAKGAFCVGMTGESGGKMANMVDLLLNVPSSKTSRIQEMHILLGHIFCGLVEEKMFG